MKLDQILAKMDFEFLSTGKHGMSIEGMRKAIKDEDFIFLDVRTQKEVDHVSFAFATHIPLNQLPDKYQQLPEDKTIICFCSSVFRGAVAYTYLRAKGFDKVKGLTGSIEDMVQAFKPGPLSKI